MHTPNVKILRTTDAASEPLSLSDAKNYLCVPTTVTSDDDLIADMITSARLECETINRRSFIMTAWQLTLDYFPPYSSKYTSLLPPAIVGPMSDRNYWLNLADVAIQFPNPPLIAVTEITYIDPGGATQVLDPAPSAQNVVISAGTPGQMTPFYGKIFPVTQPVLSAVNISYTAGYGPDATYVPKNIILAMRYLVAHYYNKRTTSGDPPDRVYRLLDATKWGK